MILVKTITIPANTLKSNRLMVPWKIVNGLVYRFELYFPPGSSGLVGVHVQDASVNIYPFDESEDFIGDNTTIAFDDELLYTGATRQLDVYVYNEDDTYEHTIQLRMGLLADEQLVKSRLGISQTESLTEPLMQLIELLTLQNSAKKTYEIVDVGAIS
jgi:hypothetical protein